MKKVAMMFAVMTLGTAAFAANPIKCEVDNARKSIKDTVRYAATLIDSAVDVQVTKAEGGTMLYIRSAAADFVGPVACLFDSAVSAVSWLKAHQRPLTASSYPGLNDPEYDNTPVGVDEGPVNSDSPYGNVNNDPEYSNAPVGVDQGPVNSNTPYNNVVSPNDQFGG